MFQKKKKEKKSNPRRSLYCGTDASILYIIHFGGGVSQVDFEILIFLPSLPECWDYALRHVMAGLTPGLPAC